MTVHKAATPSKLPRAKIAWAKPVLIAASVRDVTRGNGVSGADGTSKNPRS